MSDALSGWRRLPILVDRARDHSCSSSMAGPRRSSQPALKGMALDEMCRAAREERRRTERRRGALRRLFPQMEELADGTTKRFRILDGFFQYPRHRRAP